MTLGFYLELPEQNRTDQNSLPGLLDPPLSLETNRPVLYFPS
jgi:hypothetical protein